MSPDTVPPHIWPLGLPRAGLCIPGTQILLSYPDLFWFMGRSHRQLWQNSSCHGKRAVMLRGKVGFSIFTLSSAWCLIEWGLIGNNPVETRNRTERWGAGENWDWSGRKRRCQTCKMLFLRGRERTILTAHGGYEKELQAHTWVRESESFLSLKIAHSRKGNRPFMGTGRIY